MGLFDQNSSGGLFGNPTGGSGLLDYITAQLQRSFGPFYTPTPKPPDTYDPGPLFNGMEGSQYPFPYIGQKHGNPHDPGIYNPDITRSGDELIYQPQPSMPPPMRGTNDSWMIGPSGPYPTLINPTPDNRQHNNFYRNKYMGWDGT